MNGQLSPWRMAVSSILSGRKRYLSLALGIMMAILFVSSLLLMGQSVYYSFQDRYFRLYGKQDFILRDAAGISPERVRELGVARRVGISRVFAQSLEGGVSFGSYDALGEALRYRRVLQGRLPEKPGEIAVDQGALDRLRMGIGIGDSFDVALRTPVKGGFLEGTHTRRYTLVGITQDQLLLPEGYHEQADYWLDMPAATTVHGETALPGGREILHYLLESDPGMTEEKVSERLVGEGFTHWPLSYRFTLFDEDSGSYAAFLLALAILLCSALILSAAMVIANALNMSLAERSRQIGMLRAVGATSRQVRRLYGWEALVIALATAPLAIALSYLMVRLLIRLIGEPLQLYAAWWFLPLALILSVLAVLLAASLPLRRASSILPMQAIRDTSLLRQKKRLRIKPLRRYAPAALLARRHLTLYRQRQLGISVLVAASMLVITLACLGFAAGGGGGYEEADYTIGQDGYATHDFVDFSLSDRLLRPSDVMEAVRLPYVGASRLAKMLLINLQVDRMTPYLRAGSARSDVYFSDTLPEDPVWAMHDKKQRERYQRLLADLDITGDLLTKSLCAMDDASILALESQVTEGKIDLEALHRGEEVIVTAPKRYYKVAAPRGSGSGFWYEQRIPEDGEPVLETLDNDAFHAGDALRLTYLEGRGDDRGRMLRLDEDPLLHTTRRDLPVRIGAVIEAPAAVRPYFAGYSLITESGSMLTSLTGMDALGFQGLGYREISLSLAGEPEAHMKEYLHNTLRGIASREAGYTFRDTARIAQEQRRWVMVMWAAVASLAVIFFALSFSMVNNAMTLRLKADRSAIGTLRAVGADMGLILRSYRLQLLSMLRRGAIAGAVLSLASLMYFRLGAVNPPALRPFFWPMLLGLLPGFLVMLALLCGLSLRLQMRRVVRRSIVDNIREL